MGFKVRLKMNAVFNLYLKKIVCSSRFFCLKKFGNELSTFWMAEENIWRKVGDFEALIGEKLAI